MEQSFMDSIVGNYCLVAAGSGIEARVVVFESKKFEPMHQVEP